MFSMLEAMHSSREMKRKTSKMAHVWVNSEPSRFPISRTGLRVDNCAYKY